MTLDLHKRSEVSVPLTHEQIDENWSDVETALVAAHAGMYGDLGGANASPAIQAMIDDLGYFNLPSGTFLCQDPIEIPATSAVDTVFQGMGPGRSILEASGMTGASLIVPASLTGLYRMTMRDMSLIGDADSAFDFPLTSGLIWKSLFENMHFRSIAGPAFYASGQFTTTHLRCSFHSDEDHSIHMIGGNTTLLVNCYAHKCGSGMAGFRIHGHATLIECNGLDDATDPNYWGWFGKDTTGIYQISIVGGNAEDFRTAAIALEYDGQIDINNLAFVAPSTGTFESYIKILSGTAHRIGIRGNSRVVSKGATRSGNSNIQGTGCQPLVENNSSATTGSFPDFYNTTASLLYNVPNLQVRGDGFGKLALQITRLHSLKETGFILPGNTAITANATTFSVTDLNSVRTNNSAPTALAQLTGSEDYQELTLVIGDANTTIKHNTGGAGRFHLASGVDEKPAAGKVYRFVSYSSIWRQIQAGPAGYVTPQMFGAVADGATDDWAAIQAAIDTGAEVRLPALDDTMVYMISAPLVLANPWQSLGGLGNIAFIKALPSFPTSGSAAERSMIVLNDEHQKIENLDLHCGDPDATDIHGTAQHAIYCDNARNGTIRRIETHYSSGSGLVLHGESWGYVIELLTISYAGNWGVEMDGDFHTIENFNMVHVIDPTTGGYLFNDVEGFVMSSCALSCNTSHSVNGVQANNRVFFKATGGVKGVINGADVENSPRLFELEGNSEISVYGGRFLRFGDDASPPTDGVVKLANSRIKFEANAFEFADDFGSDGFFEVADDSCRIIWQNNQQRARAFGNVSAKNITTDFHRGKWSCPSTVANVTGDSTIYTIPFDTLSEFSGASNSDEVKTADMSAGVLTVPYSGFYRFTLEFGRTIPTGHTFEVVYYSISGGSNIIMHRRPCNTQFGEMIDSLVKELYLTAGQTIAFKWRVDGGALDADFDQCRLIHQKLQ